MAHGSYLHTHTGTVTVIVIVVLTQITLATAIERFPLSHANGVGFLLSSFMRFPILMQDQMLAFTEGEKQTHSLVEPIFLFHFRFVSLFIRSVFLAAPSFSLSISCYHSIAYPSPFHRPPELLQPPICDQRRSQAFAIFPFVRCTWRIVFLHFCAFFAYLAIRFVVYLSIFLTFQF